MKIFLFLIVLFSTPISAEIYKWTDASGRIHYSDKVKTDRPVESIEVNINSYKHVTYESLPNDSDYSSKENTKKVVMYSASWCGYCTKARNYFNSNNISFIEYDIEKDKKAKRKYDALGGKGVPVILVGKKRMNGFSVAGFNRIFK